MIQSLAHRPIGTFVTGMLLILSLVMAEICYSQNSKDEQRSLLSGQAEPHGTFKKRCRPLVVNGDLTMSIETRTGDYAMCCVRQRPPVEVKAGDEISAKIVLEKNEDEFHVKVETGDQQIVLHSQSLDAGESLIKLLLDEDALGGRGSVQILRFCIAAKGPGELQTVRVNKAIISTPGSGVSPPQPPGHRPREKW